MELGRSPRLPPELFHYTTADGLKGIMERDRIWATNYRYVNDLTELLHANGFLRDELLARLPSTSSLVQAVFEAILKTPDLLFGMTDVFVACFCEDGDLLSQWRAYGGSGGGYAIGYQDIAIRTGIVGSQYGLYKVIYKEDQQKEIINFLLDEFSAAVEQLSRPGMDAANIHDPVIYSMFEHRSMSLLSGVPEPLGDLCLPCRKPSCR